MILAHLAKEKNVTRKFLAALAIASLSLLDAHAGLGPEIRISNSAGPSIQPNIAVFGSNVFVVWSEYVGGGGFGDIFLARSTDGGATFLPAQQLTNTPGRNDILPIVAADGAQVHVFWTDSSQVGSAYHMGSGNSGVTFSAEKTLSPADSFYSRPSGAVVDSAGRVHFAYYDNRIDGTYGQVYYRCSADGGASFTPDVNLNQYDGVVDHESPRLAAGTDGTLYLLMRTNKAGFPQGGWGPADQFMIRTNGAPTSCSPAWLRPAQRVSVGLPEEFSSTYGGQLASGPSNTLHAAWWGGKAGTNLYYRRGFPLGKGWETPIDISQFGMYHPEWDGTAAEHSMFGIGDDGQGRVHAVFGNNDHLTEGFISGNLFYRCSPNGGASWSARTSGSGSANTAQPRGAAGPGAFHMVWMDWRYNNAGAEIVYRKATGCGSSSPIDLNGDGRSDVLYRNATDGRVFRLFANGTSLSGGTMVYNEPNTAWKIVGDGDFNGDGVSDLLYQNSTTNQLYLLPFNSSGLATAGSVIYTATSNAWKIVGTPDLNGDGKADLLYRNQTTGQVYAVLMNGFSIVAEGMVYTEPNTAWQIVGYGDMDGDGKQNQVIYRNTTTGQVFMLNVNFSGTFSTTGQVIYNEPNTAWQIKATADFDGDGKTDLLYRNTTTGQVYVLLMNGGAVAASAQIYSEPNSAWVIVATGDYDGDGKADLLWRNSTTGQVYMVLVNGLTTGAQAMVYTEPNTAWKVMGPVEYAQ